RPRCYTAYLDVWSGEECTPESEGIHMQHHTNTTRFTVLIERRRQPFAGLAWWLTLLVLAAAAALVPTPGSSKPLNNPYWHSATISRDLQAVLGSSKGKRQGWMRKLDGVEHVEVIIISKNADPDMDDLRQAVRQAGGFIVKRHRAVHGLTVRVPTT